MGVLDSSELASNELVMQQSRKTVCRKQGQGFPWKAFDLPSNHWMSMLRLRSTIERLRNNEISVPVGEIKEGDLLKKYDEIFREQLDSGIIEEVEEVLLDGPVLH